MTTLGLTTPADVLAAMDRTDEVIQGLDAVFSSCPSLTAATQSQWTAFKASWVNFIQQTENEIYRIPIVGLTYGLFDPFAKMTAVEGFQATVAQWQVIAAQQCGAQGPSVQTPPVSDPAWLTAVKYGTIALIVGGGLFFLAPVIETIVTSKAAGRSAASTRKLFGRKPKENPVTKIKVPAKPGDTVLFTPGALGEHSNRVHWWAFEMAFKRPDGSIGHSDWLVAGHKYATRHNFKPETFKVIGDVIWQAEFTSPGGGIDADAIHDFMNRGASNPINTESRYVVVLRDGVAVSEPFKTKATALRAAPGIARTLRIPLSDLGLDLITYTLPLSSSRTLSRVTIRTAL